MVEFYGLKSVTKINGKYLKQYRVSPNTFVAVYKVAPIIQMLAKPSPNAA